MYAMKNWTIRAGMMVRRWAKAGLIVPAAFWAVSANAQVAGGNRSSAQTLLSPNPVRVEAPVAGDVVREIDDPHTGDRWLLMRDPTHLEGPGRLVRIAGVLRPVRRNTPADAQPVVALATERTELMPVIHTGDRLILEENTAVVEARLEAIALGPAISGSPLNVRLTIGGSVVRAVALGPGRAAFAPETAARP
jgi:hypothetical protein